MCSNNVMDQLEKYNARYSIYEIRYKKYQQEEKESKIPFRVSKNPFLLPHELKEEIMNLGIILYSYFNAVISLYNTDNTVKQILDNGKQKCFIGNIPQYLFLRPDLIITEQGLKICELETSIFGLGLADILNRSYIDSGYETLVQKDDLKDYIQSVIPKEGIIAYSQRVKSFRGQLDYLADHVFSGNNSAWKSRIIDANFNYVGNVYRAFYSSDGITEPEVNNLLNSNSNFIPSLTPQFEEKAILSFIWDKRYCEFFKKELGEDKYEYLRKIIPPTFIVGQEEYFENGLPGNVVNLMEIKELPKGQRQFVIKKSSDSSWGEGIKFLHKLSHENAEKALENAIESDESYIMQQFFEGKKFPLEYCGGEMQAKIRITPYYAFWGQDVGKLVAIKATGCENMDYIHGASNSINTAVMA